MEKLLEAFNAFKDEMQRKDPVNGVRYVDALMGFHNAYKAVILEIEKQSGREGKMVRLAAVATLAKALEVNRLWPESF